MTILRLLAWTGNGVLQKPMKDKIIRISIAQEGPGPEDIPVQYVFDMTSTRQTLGLVSRC